PLRWWSSATSCSTSTSSAAAAGSARTRRCPSSRRPRSGRGRAAPGSRRCWPPPRAARWCSSPRSPTTSPAAACARCWRGTWRSPPSTCTAALPASCASGPAGSRWRGWTPGRAGPWTGPSGRASPTRSRAPARCSSPPTAAASPGPAPPVPGVRLLTPNAGEAARLAASDGAEIAGSGLSAAGRRGRHLGRAWGIDGVAVTLGSEGALLCDGSDTPFLAPARPARGDACGAGDSFAAGAVAALAGGGSLTDAVTEGVHRASEFVRAGAAAGVAARLAETGSARLVPERGEDAWDVVERTRRAGGTVVATGGCFDLLHAGHVSMLQQARRLGDCLIVCVNSDASVRRRKGPTRPITPGADRVRVLEALSDVDAALVFDDDTPAPLLERLRPDVWVKGADYAGTTLPEAETVRAHDGEVVLLPLLEGRSTTRL